MNYITLYIKQTFLRNKKKQLFLLLGIAAFMVMLSGYIMGGDSAEYRRKEEMAANEWGFSIKVFDVTDSFIEYLKGYEGAEAIEPVEKLEVIGGISNVDDVISSAVPEGWKLKLLYGSMPQKGEILLSEYALVAGRQPVPGETVILEVKVGEERKKIERTVSGVAEAFSGFTGNYAFLYEEDFATLTELLPKEQKWYDVFYIEKDEMYVEDTALFEYWDRMTPHKNLGWGHAGEEYTYDWEAIWGSAGYALIFGGPMFGAILYMILQDEKKQVGILRALGAQKRQIAAMISGRIMVSGIIGMLIGSAFSFVFPFLQGLLLHDKTYATQTIGWRSIVAIFVVGCVLLLVLQIPGIYLLLRESPMDLMSDIRHTGERLIKCSGKLKRKVKCPLWWYAGVEGKRLRGQKIGLILVSLLGMFIPIALIFVTLDDLVESEKNATAVVHTIEKAEGVYTKEEIERIIEHKGILSAGFSETKTGTGIVKVNGEDVNVKLMILDEVTLQRKKQEYEEMGESIGEGLEHRIFEENGVLLCQTIGTIRQKIKEGDRMEICSALGEYIPYEVALVGKNSGEVGFDYYVYIGFEQYCELFGVPEMANISVCLDDMKVKKVENELQSMGVNALVTENEVLYGYTKEEVVSDTWVYALTEMPVRLLSIIVFFVCYYSFYYLAKIGEYRKLYAMGASKKMIRNIMLCVAFRNAIAFATVNLLVTVVIDWWNNNEKYVNVSNQKMTIMIMLIIVVLMIGVTVGATLFASKQVLRELEQKA